MARANTDIATILIEIDGKTLNAIVDTGAAFSGLNEGGAKRLGLSSASLASGREVKVTGFGGKQTSAHLHRFDDVEIADRHMTGTTLPVLATSAKYQDAWVGLDFLRNRRIWISYSASKLFVER